MRDPAAELFQTDFPMVLFHFLFGRLLSPQPRVKTTAPAGESHGSGPHLNRIRNAVKKNEKP
jgi:hypothetical protein